MSDVSTSVRSMNSFGVSGLLSEDCKVYYDNLFNTRHVGKISDLLLARLREAGADELRLRALLLFSVFQAYRCQPAAPGEEGEAVIAPEPVLLECGIDSDHIAVGISFRISQDVDGEKLREAILSEAPPVGTFEELLASLYRYSDRLVLRIQPGEQVEAVSLLRLATASAPAGEEKAQPEIVLLGGGEEAHEAPKAEDYIELADLDYARLLSSDATVAVPPPPTGEFIAHGVSELEEAVRLRAQAAVLEQKYTVGGLNPESSPQLFRIKGEKQEELGSASTLVKGAPQEPQDASSTLVSGAGEDTTRALSEDDPRVQLYLTKIQELQQRILDLEQGKAEARVEASQATATAEKLAGSTRVITGLLKKVWPFRKRQEQEELEEGAEQLAPEQVLKEENKPSAAAEEAETVREATELLAELEKGKLDMTLNRAKSELNEIKEDVSSRKAKRWMDGLMGELVQEKARLHELAQKLNSSIRQKEMEFRTKEIRLQEEVRKRDESIRQKAHALTRAKDQLSQMSMQIDKYKSATQGKAEESHFRQKFQLSQKLLLASKDEVSKLTSKVDDLKGQLASAQMALKSRGTNTASMELQTLRTKNERSVRQLEELRGINEQLTARIQQLATRSEKAGKPEAAENPKKLEASMKQLAVAQKDNEQLKLRVEELSREDVRLKSELKRALLEVKSLRQRASQRPGGSKPEDGGTKAA
ncbi:MAG: hypothetical protein NDJ90_04870 [Oligoflexia bacterium]|nr:hypothetical protein [Oligoflexia bacterium]